MFVGLTVRNVLELTPEGSREPVVGTSFCVLLFQFHVQ